MTGTLPLLPDDLYLKERLARYLPSGVDVELLSDEQITKLTDIYRGCRKDATEYFRRKILEELEPTFEKTLLAAIRNHLPSETAPWDKLGKEQQERVNEIYTTCYGKNLTITALRKHIRAYLVEGIDDFDITETEAPAPRLFKAKETKQSKELEKLRVWVQVRLDNKGCITRTDDFEEFHKKFGYAKRTFSKKMRMLGLIFDGKKWVMP